MCMAVDNVYLMSSLLQEAFYLKNFKYIFPTRGFPIRHHLAPQPYLKPCCWLYLKPLPITCGGYCIDEQQPLRYIITGVFINYILS